MEKTESLKKRDVKPAPPDKESSFGEGIKSNISNLSNWFFGFTKFILGVCLLPFVCSLTLAFINELSRIDKLSQDYFWLGVISLITVHLLIWEPAIIYNRGHKILELVFSYFKPLVKVAPYLLPIYTIVLFLLYLILSLFVKSPELLRHFIFLFSFTTAMHLVFSAKTLRSKKNDFLKGNYIFGFAFVYLINLMILSFFLNIIFDKFSFVNFSNQSFLIAKGIFNFLFRQLFL